MEVKYEKVRQVFGNLFLSHDYNIPGVKLAWFNINFIARR